MSLHDTDARPIAKGRLGRPVEFGYKAQVADDIDGIVLDHLVEVGNPHDAPTLAPAIRRISRRFAYQLRAEFWFGQWGHRGDHRWEGVPLQSQR